MVLQKQNIEDPQAPWIDLGLGLVQTFQDMEVVRVKVVAGTVQAILRGVRNLDLIHQGTVEHQ